MTGRMVMPTKDLTKALYPHPLRYRVSAPMLALLREMANGDEKAQAEIQRKALVELGRNEHPAAFRKYLIATGGRKRG